MRSIIYVSTVVQPFEEQDLTVLVAQAAARNMEHRITGLLAYNGFNFMQLLEGPGAPVEDRLARIATDPRHTGVVVIRRDEVAVRECPSWAMTGRVLPAGGLGRAPLAPEALPATIAAETQRLFGSFASFAPI